jgi:hypothetical protein
MRKNNYEKYINLGIYIVMTGVKGGKWHSLWPNAFFADLGLFTLSEAHRHRSLTPMLQVYAQCIA